MGFPFITSAHWVFEVTPLLRLMTDWGQQTVAVSEDIKTYLMERYGLTQVQAAQALGKSQSAIANKLRILRHSEAVLVQIRQSGLTERHARALLKLRSDEEKLCAIAEIARQGMSVARAEKYIDTLLSQTVEKSQKANVGAFLNSLTQSLQKIQSSGIRAISERRETDTQIVLTITIPKDIPNP